MKKKLNKMFFVEALVINIAVLLFLLFMLCQKLNGSLDCFEYRVRPAKGLEFGG